MKKLISHGLFAFSAAATLAVLALGGQALADRTVTFLSAGDEVTSMYFDFLTQPGKVVSNVCGHAPLAGGGFGPTTCYPVTLTSGAVFTAVLSLATGNALAFWKTQDGL